MQYNGYKARCAILWLAQQMDVPSIPLIWPMIYLAERRYLSMMGMLMLGDSFVAMHHGPVPLRAYAEFHLKVGSWKADGSATHLDAWLKRVAASVAPSELLCRFTVVEQQCLHAASVEVKAVGRSGLDRLVKGAAWQRAGPDGILDPLEIALEGGADDGTLDYLLRWREQPYLMELGPYLTM